MTASLADRRSQDGAASLVTRGETFAVDALKLMLKYCPATGPILR